MSSSTDSGPTLSSSGSQSIDFGDFDDRPDDLFALVGGPVAALVVAPLVTAGAARVIADPALSYVLAEERVVAALDRALPRLPTPRT